MANRCLETFTILKPLGLVTRQPLPSVEPALRAGTYLKAGRIQVPMGPRRPSVSAAELGKVLTKASIARGDVLIRNATGDVYAVPKRDPAALRHLGGLADILDVSTDEDPATITPILIDAVHASGLRRCGDQSCRITPIDILHHTYPEAVPV